MIELELAGAQHQILVLRLELLVEQIQVADYDPAAVGDALACALGKWLRGAGKALAHLPAYDELVRQHESFHLHAMGMVSLFKAGDVAAARQVQAGPFSEASRAVVAAVASLKQAGRAAEQSRAPGSETASGLPLAIDPETLTGIAVIDAQHREITEIIVRLLVHPHDQVGAPMMADTLRELGALIALHFESEELFMQHAGIPAPELEAHRREHAELLDRYRRLALEPELHDDSGPCNVCLAVEQWMTDHIRVHDLALRAYAHIPYP